MTTHVSRIAALTLALGLSGCSSTASESTGDASTSDAAATDAGATSDASAPSDGGDADAGPLPTTAGCTGKAAAFFTLAKGTYSAPLTTFGADPSSMPTTVAGFSKGANTSVTIRANCTIVVGTFTLTYTDGSYGEFPGTGADVGRTQYDVDLSGAGVATAHFERFVNDKRGLSFFDPTSTQNGARVDEP